MTQSNMNMWRDPNSFLLVGGGGREAAIAVKLHSEGCKIYSVCPFPNPTIKRCVEESEGEMLIAPITARKDIVKFALKHKIGFCFITNEKSLHAGVVDALLHECIPALGGTKKRTRIEWDKIYAMQMMKKLFPKNTPYFKVVRNPNELRNALEIAEKENMEVVIKPNGLTAGKGVRVMGKHIETYEECFTYGSTLLYEGDSVIVSEKIVAREFTIAAFTDGESIRVSPACYDYPYRYEGDKGANTGGMGCVIDKNKSLPFMRKNDLRDAKRILARIVEEQRLDEKPFKGVITAGFFSTKKGLMFCEFNCRLGDPEAINLMQQMTTSLSELIREMWSCLTMRVKYRRSASISKYFVAEDYPNAKHECISFGIVIEKIEAKDVDVIFAATRKSNDESIWIYESVGASRVLALRTSARSIELAVDKIHAAKKSWVHGSLHDRYDIGRDIAGYL